MRKSHTHAEVDEVGGWQGRAWVETEKSVMLGLLDGGSL